jgi:hypothetical protein
MDRTDRVDRMTTSAAVTAAAPPPHATGRPVVFRAGCPHCRASFELGAGALRLAIGGSARTTFYSFTCPECGEAVRKPAGERIVELLTVGGVRTMRLA